MWANKSTGMFDVVVLLVHSIHCSRVCDGFCVRFYTRQFFESLEAHEDAEIITKPLDSVLLQLKIMNFPAIRESLQGCITPPDDAQVRSLVAHRNAYHYKASLTCFYVDA